MKVKEIQRANSMPPGATTTPETLGRQVALALYGASNLTVELEQQAKHRSMRKDKPKATQAKVKPKSKKSRKKSSGSSKGPSLRKMKRAWHLLRVCLADRELAEERRYALWWDIHTDRSSQYVTIPIGAKERNRRMLAMENSQRSKASIARVKAVGFTPRGHEGLPTNEDWCFGAPVGIICHESEPEFKQVVDNSSEYIKVLSTRYCYALEQESLTSHPRLSRMVNTKQLEIRGPALVIITRQRNNSAEFSWEVRRENTLARLTAELFDLYDEVPAANDSVFDRLERQYECDQWPISTPLPINYDVYNNMCMGYLPVETDLIGYVQWHNEAELRSLMGTTFLTNLTNWAMSDEEIQGRMYLHWLEYHTSGSYQWDRRVRMEHARSQVDPLYVMDLGTYIHELEQTNPDQYQIMINNLRVSSDRIARECLQVDNLVTWYIRSTYLINATSMRRSGQEKMYYDIKKQELLVEKLISQAYRTRISYRDWSRFMDGEYLHSTSFKKWSRSLGEDRYISVLDDVVEEATQLELLPTDIEVSPTDSKGDAVQDTAKQEVGSNVLNFLFEKEKRAETVKELLTGQTFDFSFDDYTTEEKEGVLKFGLEIIAAVEAASEPPGHG